MSERDAAEGGREPAAVFPYPVERIAFDRTVRLVTTARLRDPVLLKLVGKELFDDLAEIEGATSGRLTAEQRGADAIGAGEFVAGLPHAAFINAAFSYWRPRELNRFNGPGAAHGMRLLRSKHASKKSPSI